MLYFLKHKEKAFNIAQSELENIFHFYSTQSSATSALYLPLNSFEISNRNLTFLRVLPGHTSNYNDYIAAQTNTMRVDSDILYSGNSHNLVDGFSIGTFSSYSFIINAKASIPNNSELSNQI